MAKTDWSSKYGDSRPPSQIKRLPREEMISTARRCCLLEHLSDSEIDGMSTTAIRREIDSVVLWMEGPF
jgi:hypothetical protein